MSQYRRKRRYSGGNWHRRSIGHEKALEHIREAKALSGDLAGTDQIVRRFFFSLSESQLQMVLNRYGRKYGASAKGYAARTIPKWKDGTTHMSGLVAGRLYELLPPIMPLDIKFQIVRELWEAYGPKARYVILFRRGVPADEIADAAKEKLAKLEQHTIPDQVKDRFEWLSAGDVELRQQLLNHYRGIHKKQISDFSTRLISQLNDYVNEENRFIDSMNHTFSLGQYHVRLQFNPKLSENVIVRDELDIWSRGQTAATESSNFFIWLGIAAGIGAVIYWLASQ